MDMHHLLFAGDTMQHDADRGLIHSTESMEISPVKMQVMFAFIAYVQWQFVEVLRAKFAYQCVNYILTVTCRLLRGHKQLK